MQHLDIGRALTFGFEDGEWVVKLFLGALLFLVGLIFSVVLIGVIPLLMLGGYAVAIARNVAEGQDVPLPRWEDFGDLLADGFRLAVAYFLWSLPSLILTLPVIIGAVLIPDRGDGWAVLWFLLLLCCGLPALVYSLFVTLISPVIMWQVAAERSVAAALNVRQVWHIFTSHLGSIIIIVLVLWGVNLLAGLVGFLLCGVGFLATFIWYLWVEGHLVGQLGRLARGTAAPTVEVVSP